MTVTRVFFYLAPRAHLDKVVGPLLRLLPISKEIERVTLANLIEARISQFVGLKDLNTTSGSSSSDVRYFYIVCSLMRQLNTL